MSRAFEYELNIVASHTCTEYHFSATQLIITIKKDICVITFTSQRKRNTFQK